MEEFIFPVSFAQQRLWFLDQLEPGNPAYNIPLAVRMSGSLNLEVLQLALNTLVARHESLRTTFATVEGNPFQVIAADIKVALPVTELRPLPEAEIEAEVQSLATEESNRPFDLVQGPLVRTRLLRLSDEEHILLIVMHHIISDGWSVEVFLRELMVLYEAFLAWRPSPLPELPIQYVDFAVWQREWLQGEVLDQQLAYWKQQLAGAPPGLELPTDHPRPMVQSFRGAWQSQVLSPNLLKSLNELSRREGVTLFMTLLAAFQTLLARYSGQEDITVGSPIAGRNRVEIEGIIGAFINMLVLRTDLSGDPTFCELLGRVREVALGAYAHQDLPFEKLVEELQPERTLSRNPLFQVLFIFGNYAMEELKLPGLNLRLVEFDSKTTQFDMVLEIVEKAEGLSCLIAYNTDLFEAATIRRMLKHFHVLLEAVLADPERSLSSLPLLTESERQELLVEWNGTKLDYPKDRCLHELFEGQVARTPDAIAAAFEQERLTYRELNDSANQLAHYLQRRGVRPEVIVGICMPRSVEMMVALLGVLKAGGAYLPLDPAYPTERLRFMLEDAAVPIVLTHTDLVRNLPVEGSAALVCMDAEWEAIARECTQNTESIATGENLAYVIYTSGSTGKPKGMLITHRAIVSHSVAVAQYYELRPSDRVLQFASLSFDVAAEELYPTWLSGATVVMQPSQVAASIFEFTGLLERQRVTVVNLPTPYWHEWVSELFVSKGGVPATLRLVIVGTDKALPERLAMWRQVVGDGVRWINAYGPTEATITTTAYKAQRLRADAAVERVPIGRPLANKQVYILDRHLQPVPIGVSGEIYI
ncbi:MAG: amino acid adenylation domain-containing protein, partial [Acidobacteriota bacterium]|nr:amino acid adenylation domain-containing protein [Acidobacteriota bacterium]